MLPKINLRILISLGIYSRSKVCACAARDGQTLADAFSEPRTYSAVRAHGANGAIPQLRDFPDSNLKTA